MGDNPLTLEFTYENHRGVTERRRVLPMNIWYSATEHHPVACWMLRAHCLDRKALRDFKLTKMRFP